MNMQSTMQSMAQLSSQPLAQSLAQLTEAIRVKPSDFKLRVYLVQLLCIMGQWKRALNQLNVAAELDSSAIPMKQVYADAIQGEGLRAEVFAGKRSPLLFGEPSQWIAMLIESLIRIGNGEKALGLDLRAKAFESAPSTAGKFNGTEFDWLSDGDMRLGPVLEAYVNGRYYWLPFERVQTIKIEAPEDLRDYVWTPAHLQFVNGGETLALIPTRYPGSEAQESAHVQLGLKTEWHAFDTDVYLGFGQRSFSSDQDDYALMDAREITFHQAT